MYEFGPFQFDAADRRLFCKGHPVPLRTKLFDTLLVLLQHPGRLIRKDDLIKAVWPETIVEESNLAHNISVLRRILGKQETGTRYIETIPGQGYRFLAEVKEVPQPTSIIPPCPPVPVVPHGRLVQRDNELRSLRGAFEEAAAGSLRIVFVTGESGLGKTFLVDTFVDEIRTSIPVLYGHGQCLKHGGEGEAYMPLLEALGRMCRDSGGRDLTALLARCAPTWLVQMPWLLSEAEFDALQRRTLGTTRERMLRELVESFETLTAERPLLLVLEDLHWSDYSTVEFLGWIARRREPTRLMLIGTYRPTDVRISGHPVHAISRDLQMRGLCEELQLDFLTEEAIQEYLAARFRDGNIAARLAPVVWRRTEGNPLFMVNVVDHWIAQGLITCNGREWEPLVSEEELAATVPDTLRQLIEEQLASLEPEDQQILESASVAGRKFAAQAVAAAIERPDEEVEARCAKLAERSQFLNARGTSEWPDGTLSARYSFIHDLHHEVLYSRVPPARKARLHHRIGQRLETAYGRDASEVAPELAAHFVRGRDPSHAVLYLRYSAEQGLARSAHREAIEQIKIGLHLLQTAPESPERTSQEADLQNLLARALIATKGWGAPEARDAYLRARNLCQSLSNPPEISSSVSLGLATLLEVRGEYKESQLLIEEQLPPPPTSPPTPHVMVSHELMACSLFHQGEFNQALDHAEQGLRMYDPDQRYTLLAFYGDNPAVSCHAWSALSLWFLGFPDRAVDRIRQSVIHARDHSYSFASAQTQAAVVHQYRREPETTRKWAEGAICVAREQGFPYRAAVASVHLGWALAISGDHSAGVAQLRQGLSDCRATGAQMDDPYYLALLADAYGASEQPEDGLIALTEAFAAMRDGRTFFYEAELHRLWGTLLLQAGIRDEYHAEESFRQALKIARRQSAKCLELRAALSLSRLWRHQKRRADARELLVSISECFSEGFGTPDMRQAKSLLTELQGARAMVAGDHGLRA